MIVARPQSLLLFRLPTTAAESEKMPKKRDERDSGGIADKEEKIGKDILAKQSMNCTNDLNASVVVFLILITVCREKMDTCP